MPNFEKLVELVENLKTKIEADFSKSSLLANCDEIFAEIENLDAPVKKTTTGKGRGKSDPVRDQQIFDRVVAKDPSGNKKEKVEDIAKDLGISRQSVFKAVKRVEEKQAQSNIVQTPAGPYSPSNDQLRAAGELLFGKRVGNNKEDIVKAIKKGIDYI